MNRLEDVCQRLIAEMKISGPEMEETAADLGRFDKEIAAFISNNVNRRLHQIENQVLEKAAECMKYHCNGIIAIATDHEGYIYVYRYLEPPLFTEGTNPWQQAITIVSLDQFQAFIKQLRRQLLEGDVDSVLNWIKQHAIVLGNFLGL